MYESNILQMSVQPKLTIGSADDPLEDEADSMADKVMRMPMPEPIIFSSSKNIVNRKCAECEEEEREKLQRKETGHDSTNMAPPIVHDVLNSSSGRSLDADTRSFMEPRFNYDFSHVKVHDNELAAKSASSINALAYTSGNNVVFNSGQYNTNSDSGKRLLAHELTHVVQQSGADIQKQGEATPSQEEATPTQEETIPAQTETTPAPEATGDQRAKFIVEDSEIPAEGQMGKSDFLNQLNTEVCQTVDEALQGSPFSSDNCPYIRAAFARHQNSTPFQLEQVLARYEPSTRTAQSADDLIQLVKVRVSAAAIRWLQTGDLSDLPEEIRSQIPGGLLAVSGIFSSISSAIGSIGSGIKSIVSGIGSLFFKANPGGAQATQLPASIIQRLGKGSAMDGSSRGKMEIAFGTSFSDVEVHTDSNAASLASNMNARAFTIGNHIAFGSGEHQPGTLAGDALMAHELAHTIQQSGNDIFQKSIDEGTQINQAAENEADVAAVEAVSEIWGNNQLSLKKIIQPKIKNSLSIQRCGSAQRPAITPHPVRLGQAASHACTMGERQSLERINPCCTTGMLSEITGHLSYAIAYVENAINRLSNPTDLRDQLWNNFRITPDDPNISQIRNMLQNILDTMLGNRITFLCRSSTEESFCHGDRARTGPACQSSGPVYIHFCGEYQAAASNGSAYLPGGNWIKTVIHEYAHAGCPGGDLIFAAGAEFYKNKHQYPQTPDRNIKNADCYAWFVIDSR